MDPSKSQRPVGRAAAGAGTGTSRGNEQAANRAAKRRGPKSAARPELSLELLMEAAGIRTVKEFARRAGVSRPTVYAWRDKGLSYWKADELAIKLAGEHPALVFGPVWFGLDESQVAVAA